MLERLTKNRTFADAVAAVQQAVKTSKPASDKEAEMKKAYKTGPQTYQPYEVRLLKDGRITDLEEELKKLAADGPPPAPLL